MAPIQYRIQIRIEFGARKLRASEGEPVGTNTPRVVAGDDARAILPEPM